MIYRQEENDLKNVNNTIFRLSKILQVAAPVALAAIAFLITAFPLNAQEIKIQKTPIVAKRSVELEELLKKGRSVESYKKKTEYEDLVAGLAAAIGNPQAEIRYNAANYLLSHEAPKEIRILPFIQQALQKIIEGKVETFSRWKGKDVLPLVRLMSRYPALSSIPFLLRVTERQDLLIMEGKIVLASDGQPLPIRNPHDIFPDVARPLYDCSDGKIGAIVRGWMNYLEREKLIDQWKAWWSANKPEKE